MHPLISVAVPTRHRDKAVSEFINSYFYSLSNRWLDKPYLTILHDAPDKLHRDNVVSMCDEIQGAGNYSRHMRSVVIPHKGGMSELWNWSIMFSPTDWVLICNDDVTFNVGWLEYLEQTIATGQFLLIELFHYGAFCIHKSMMLEVGFFDERYRHGGWEDLDYMTRISEAGLKDKVDTSHDFIRREGDVEIGHFVNHHKYQYKLDGWHGDNEPWFRAKWAGGRKPTIRTVGEIDWHPSHTAKFASLFNMRPRWHGIVADSINTGRLIYV